MKRYFCKCSLYIVTKINDKYQDKGDRGKELLKLYPEYSRASLYHHAAKSMDSTQVVDKSKFNKD